MKRASERSRFRTLFMGVLASTVAGCLVTLLGCSEAPPLDGDNADAGAPDGPASCVSQTMIRVSGRVLIHPLTLGMEPSANLFTARITLKDPILTLVGKDAELKHGDCRIATVPLAPTRAPNESDFAFEPVDASRLTVGLIGSVDDYDPKDDRLLRASSGLAGGTLDKDLTGVTAFAITNKTEAKLAPLVKDPSGMPLKPGELYARGFILGQFLTAKGEPISGVEVVNLEGKRVPGVIYPDDGLSDVTTTGTTGKHGSFVVPEAMLKSFSGKKAGYTFPTQQAASIANGCFLLTLVAQ